MLIHDLKSPYFFHCPTNNPYKFSRNTVRIKTTSNGENVHYKFKSFVVKQIFMKNLNKSLLLCIIIIMNNYLHAQITPEWVNTYSFTKTHTTASDIIHDAEGNIYMGATSSGAFRDTM